MAVLIYPIVPNFPVGVNPEQLLGELVAVWPADLFPVESSISGQRPDAIGAIHAGALELTTQRVLAGSENQDALDHFATHVPLAGASGGVMTATLLAGVFNGQTEFVLDADRQGVGEGVLCYWDGRDRNWRRIRDDVSIAAIP